MHRIAALLIAGFLWFPGAALAQDGPRLSLAAMQAGKDFKTLLDEASAAKTGLELSTPPGAGLFDTIFATSALQALPPATARDISWLSEWLNVAAASYVGIINHGADPGGEPLQQAVQDNVLRYEDRLSAAMDFLLRLMPRVAVSAQAFMQTLPEKERSQPIRQKGLAQVRDGYLQTVSGALTFISGGPKPENSRLLSLALRDTADTWGKLATAAERSELLSLLAQARNGAKDATVNDNLIAASAAIAAMK